MLIKKACKLTEKLLESGSPKSLLNYIRYMKKLFLAIIVFVAVCFNPAMAEESVAVKAVKARANVLASALEMLSLEGAATYPLLLANGIDGLAKQMKVVENIIDDLDESVVAAAEAGLLKSANFDKLKEDYRAVVRLVASKNYYGCEELEEALEDLDDEIQDME